MEFELPKKNGYTIYTKSGCTYCRKAKFLLEKENVTMIDCDEYLIEARSAFLDFIRSINGNIEYKTFPMIFHDGRFVGGYTELANYYAKETAFEQCMF